MTTHAQKPDDKSRESFQLCIERCSNGYVIDVRVYVPDTGNWDYIGHRQVFQDVDVVLEEVRNLLKDGIPGDWK
jgi:hypothetical protein